MRRCDVCVRVWRYVHLVHGAAADERSRCWLHTHTNTHTHTHTHTHMHACIVHLWVCACTQAVRRCRTQNLHEQICSNRMGPMRRNDVHHPTAPSSSPPPRILMPSGTCPVIPPPATRRAPHLIELEDANYCQDLHSSAFTPPASPRGGDDAEAEAEASLLSRSPASTPCVRPWTTVA